MITSATTAVQKFDAAASKLKSKGPGPPPTKLKSKGPGPPSSPPPPPLKS